MDAIQAVLLVNVEGPLRKAISLSGEEEFNRMAARFGFEDHLRSLVRSLENIQAFLLDAEEKSVSSAEVKVWLKKVNGLTAMADDLLDEYAYEVRRLKVELHEDNKKRNKVRNFFSLSNSFVGTRVKMSRWFKYINSSFRSLPREAHSFGLQEKTVDPSPLLEQFRRTTDSSVVESQMFETGYDAPKLKKVLLKEAENDEDLFFVSIVGMGGIGKTTLAHVLYKDAEVVNHFDERMWVCVSEIFSVNYILQEMFETLTHTVLDPWSSSRETVLLKLLERLKGKKFLLVLDDVWNPDLHLWDLLTNCLLKLGGSRGSKIMVTTRIAQTANSLKPGLRWEMCVQPVDYSWELFHRIAFAPGGPEMTPTLEKVGRKLVIKCSGVPLAIKALGGLLYTMRNEPDWLSILNSDIWNFNPIAGVLKLSYDHFPSKSLKQCFLYCSVFPKDSVIGKDDLIQLWMAQGLLNPPHGSDLSMEDLGAQYLDFFVRTSFLQNAEQDEFDSRKSYKMHDVVHDLALSLSKDYCSIMAGTNIAGNDFGAVHVSLIHCQVEILESSRGNFRKLRTLCWLDCGGGVLGDKLAYATSLRVLIVVDWLVEELPAQIGKLKLLHHLDISQTKIVKLPGSISKLYNLQTLRLYDLIELPKNFENLVNLRHLYIESFKDLDKLSTLPPRFQELINPSSFKASFKAYLHKNCPIEKLDVLLEHPDRYASLGIYRLENVNDYEEASKAKLSSMSTIERLQLHWNARRENCCDEDVLEGLQPHSNIKHLIIENYKGSAFPTWMANSAQPLILLHLVKIELEDCSCCEQVPPLGHLPYLKIVKILGMVNVKKIGAEFYGLTNLNDQSSSSSSAGVPVLFPALRELTIREMTCLENWSEPEHLSYHSSTVCPRLEKFEVEQCPKLIRFPYIINSSHRHLRRLEIALCDSLACLPEGLGKLQSLEDLDIRGLPALSQLSIGRCDNLKSLTIGGFSSASEVAYHTQHAFSSQTSLHLKGGSGKLTSLPEELQYLSALRYLTISGYGGLESLPEWFFKLQSLQILKLEFCWKLMYLPAAEKMQQLTDLDELDVCYCPLLEERCTKGSRPEWHKISHITRIKINSEEIKSRRRNKN